ncbi:hypothetical protein ACP275_05G081600 [Erythranthe tilingii]
MRSILGITNDLSQALQRKDHDLANAMKLVIFAKDRLQELREGGWDDLLRETSSFCVQNNILIPNMNDDFVLYSRDGRVSRKGTQTTNLNRYKVDVLYTMIDLQLSELNDRFDNTNRELLSLISCFDPSNSFSAFDRKALLSLILSVATASVERIFSAMKIVKSEVRNRMGDQMLNDVLVPYF